MANEAMPDAPRLRRATPEDGPAVRAFVFATLRSYGIEPDPEGLDADVMAFGTATDPRVLELVVEADGAAVGSVAIAPHAQEGPETGHLSKFFMDARYRGKGLGRPLLRRAVEEARALGYRRLVLETRTAFAEACHLYESTGWQRGPDLPPGYGPDRTYSLALAP
ncbi:MAG TPA: GNAT family N-acetyltransferase [Dehalococcoidia bacterium]|nr:GNAT family N-acetyltransferase [Dehalococcoidia bacterium]